MLATIISALVAYGPLGLLLVGFIDSLGIPLPAMDFFLLGIALKAPERAYFAALMAVLGSLCGNVALFLGARHGVRRLVKTVEDPGKPRRFREWFQRYGLVTVFVPAVVPLLPLPLKVFVISAGVLHTPIGKFVVVVLVARLLRYFGDAWLGIHLGSGAQGFLVRNAWTLAGIALALSLVFFLWIRWAGRKNPAA